MMWWRRRDWGSVYVWKVALAARTSGFVFKRPFLLGRSRGNCLYPPYAAPFGPMGPISITPPCREEDNVGGRELVGFVGGGVEVRGP